MNNILAFDVAKAKLDVFDGDKASLLSNDEKDVRPFLERHRGWNLVCEPTSGYHLKLVEIALELGLTVYLVNPKEFRNYKDSLAFRAKTDTLDAKWLHEYLARNHDKLRPFTPAPLEATELKNWIRKRDQLVKSRESLSKSLGEGFESLFEELCASIKRCDHEIERLAKGFPQYKTLLSITGIGPLNAALLVALFASVRFSSVEAVVAYVGLDPRVHDSGMFRGKRRLSKRGDPLYRKLLALAGSSLLASKLGREMNIKLKANGRHYAERMVIAGRKLLVVAFALYKRNEPFDTEKWKWA